MPQELPPPLPGLSVFREYSSTGFAPPQSGLRFTRGYNTPPHSGRKSSMTMNGAAIRRIDDLRWLAGVVCCLNVALGSWSWLRLRWKGYWMAFVRFLGCLVGLCGVLPAEEANDLRLTLPPTGYAVVGQPMSVYVDNAVLIEKPTELEITASSDLGGTMDGPVGNVRWTFTPTETQIGAHECKITVKRGDQVATGSMSWVVSPAKVSSDREAKLLIIGDSLTHGTIYPNDLARRLTESGVKWTMLGTHRPPNALPGVAHEGYGGWRWETFLTHFEPNPDPDKAKRKYSSPFLFQVEDQRVVDVPRYLKESCGGEAPDFVIFLLGVNDAFGFDPNDPVKLDGQIDGIFRHAETLLKAFREAAPHAELGVCLTTPGNSRDESFQNNYAGRYPRWGWKRIQHRLVEREIKHFSGREKENIRMVPVELNLDTFDGYPELDSVHPNEAGYKQVAASIHAWLMSRLATP